MKDDLLKQSAEAGQRAMRHYLNDEPDQFFLQAGVSLELAGKALLAAIHPTLIIAQDFDSLLHVCGGSKHAKSLPWKLRTIGAQDVLKRSIQIEPNLASFRPELELLAGLRNSAVHLGSVPQLDVRKVFRAYLSGISILCQSCGQTLADFFGEFVGVAQTYLDESAAEVERVVAEKIAKATNDFQSKYAGLTESERVAIFKILTGSYDRDSNYEETDSDCPACRESGRASGRFDVGWVVDYDDEGNIENGFPTVTLYADFFRCAVCGLELNNAAELDAAGIEKQIEIEDVDPSDFYGVDY